MQVLPPVNQNLCRLVWRYASWDLMCKSTYCVCSHELCACSSVGKSILCFCCIMQDKHATEGQQGCLTESGDGWFMDKLICGQVCRGRWSACISGVWSCLNNKNFGTALTMHQIPNTHQYYQRNYLNMHNNGPFFNGFPMICMNCEYPRPSQTKLYSVEIPYYWRGLKLLRDTCADAAFPCREHCDGHAWIPQHSAGGRKRTGETCR